MKRRFVFFFVLLGGVGIGALCGAQAAERRVATECLAKRRVVVHGVHFSCRLGPAAPGYRE